MGMFVLYSVVAGLVLFVLYMLIVTTAMGTEHLKVPQFLMSSLTYSEEATIKLNLLIDKYEAGLLKVVRNNKSLIFTDSVTGDKAGIISIGGRYYSYGILHRYGTSESNEWSCNKPNIKTFKRIIKLEKSLENVETVLTDVPKSTKSSKEEVILD